MQTDDKDAQATFYMLGELCYKEEDCWKEEQGITLQCMNYERGAHSGGDRDDDDKMKKCDPDDRDSCGRGQACARPQTNDPTRMKEADQIGYVCVRREECGTWKEDFMVDCSSSGRDRPSKPDRPGRKDDDGYMGEDEASWFYIEQKGG